MLNYLLILVLILFFLLPLCQIIVLLKYFIIMTFQNFVEKIKEFEGLRLKSYRCPSGVLTIGYGHTHGVTESMSILPIHAERFLDYDISLVVLQLCSFHDWILDSPKCPPRGVFFALVDFVFNVGFTKYKNSTLCKKYISKGIFDIEAISIQLLLWTKSNGKVLKGLERRRSWEVSLLFENF